MARQKNNDNGGADYFSHDIDMRNDIKVKALRRKFSHTGYAVWCFMLEYLTDCTNFEFDYNEVSQELLASDFDVPVAELREIIAYSVKIGLLQHEDGKIFSAAHKRRFVRMLEVRQRRAEAARRNGRKGGNPNFKKGQPNPYYRTTESVMEDNPNITQEITEDNPIVEQSNVEYSRVKKQKESPKGEKKTASRFSAPTVDEVRAYAQEKGYNVDPEHFVDYYTSNGWRVGRNPMKDWRATVRTWASRDRAQTPVQGTQSLGVGEFINSKGIRTYGTSGQPVPPQAPPRPSEAHYWSETTNQWEKTI
ncbi:DUF4373 domain-containing protein [uncultured Duncaniella sp.]|uniref:DUF4373 domain-containing protein n=1 Tax=uncultured Duncaniella sp. TaxID=2768039 RepID=UPI00272A005F|nr:DUF4373 domain-containing protein [uncultured Duncaniella sp.]